MSPSIPQALEFLTTLTKDRGYSAVATARSALSSILILPTGEKFGEHIIVKQYMKGFFNMKPPQPRYVDSWDIDDVLKLLKSWSPAQKLSVLKLSMKTVMLILIVTGQRAQIVNALHIEKMKLSNSSVTFFLENKDLKQGRQGYKPRPLYLRAYPDKRLCVVHYIGHYLKRTLKNRAKTKQLFLTTVKPVKPVSRDTVSRWIKDILQEAGIDVGVYKPGSVRMASTSKAKAEGVPIDEILQTGGWSQQNTFTKWYKKEIKKPDTFAKAVLPKTK